MTLVRCKKCGSLLEKRGEMYICLGCGAQFKPENARRNAEELSRILDEQKQEAVANLRAQLWRETQEEYINDTEIIRLAKEVKRYLPDDYFANFCALACGNNNARLNAFLGETDVSEQRMFVWDVLRLMLHLLKEDNLLAVNDFLSRVGNDCDDTEMYDRYNRQLIREAEKIDKGVYDVQLPRDAFIAYKSEDMGKVIGLVEELERQGLKCFVAARNLQHGAMRHYEEKLYEAMDHCKVVVFVSSTRSRSRRCDALSVELAYIRQKDVEAAPAKYRNYYEKMPPEYKKPRVEYVIEAYKGGDAAEEIVDEFFAGYERCLNKQEVARRVLEYVASAPVSNVKYCVACGAENGKKAKFCSECGGREFVSTREEWEERQREQAERAIREAEAVRKAEEDRRRAEEEKKKAAQAQKLAEEEKKKAEAEAEALRAELERLKAAEAEAVNVKYCVYCGSENGKKAKRCSVCGGWEFVSTREEWEEKKRVIAEQTVREAEAVRKAEEARHRAEEEKKKAAQAQKLAEEERKKAEAAAEALRAELERLKAAAAKSASESAVDAPTVQSNPMELKPAVEPLASSTEDFEIKGGVLVKYKGKGGEVVIPNNVTSIGVSAFEGCGELTSITIPNSLKSIGVWAFLHCSGLTSITIPNGVTSIGREAFLHCSGLMSIIAERGNPEYHSAGNCLIETKTKKLIAGCKNSVIPSDGSVTSIGNLAFAYCGELTSITIPNSVTSIGERAFFDCSGLTSIIAERGNPEYHSAGNCLIETKTKTLIAGCENSVIPSDGSVTSIGDEAFYNCNGLTSIKIPNSVTRIGDRVFSGCSGLTSITIPNGVKIIGERAFSGCRGLTSVLIPNSVTSIGREAFSDCSGLTSIMIPNSVTSIASSTFFACSGLTSIMIPNSVTSIEELAFWGCRGLTSVLIPYSVTNIRNRAFLDCSGLTSITIPDSVTHIGDCAFSDCSGLTSITIPDGVKRIGRGALSNNCPAKIYCHRKKPLIWPKGWDKSLKGKIIWDK